MPRKKKEEAPKVEYPWSKYQEEIFSFIEHEQGHLVIEATAGSGKTTTLVKCLDFIPNSSRVLLTAFNTDIVNELKKRVSDRPNVDVRTIHSLGLLFIKKNIPQATAIIEPFKYDAFIKNNIRELSSINIYSLRGREYFRYIENVKKYIDFGRCYLCQTVNDLNFIEDRYAIDTIADEKEVALKVMEWGRNALETIDYTDMIWLPHVLFLKPLGLLYDFIIMDEVQDLNKAERELVLKCFKMGTRMVSAGDSQQCQPKGTKVLLPDGSEKNIEDLNVGDYVVTYNSDYGYYVGYKKLSRAGNISYQQCKKITSIEHHIENELITIETITRKKSSYTPSHICYARLNKKFQNTAYCTYIMRNEKNMYRIGKVKLAYHDYFSLNRRMIDEGCTDAWIIGIFKTEKEARICEIVNSYKFGIPQIIFDYERACGKKRNTYFVNEEICEIYEKINENIEERVIKCLKYNNKKIEYPFISKGEQNYISSDHFTTFRACNLFPEFMEVNTFDENNIKYKYKKKNTNSEYRSKVVLRTPEIISSITYTTSDVEVYSLDVEDLHNYVADGILTHNCLYTFSGADSESFNTLKSLPNTTCLPLSISYRCAKNIVKFANKIVPTIEAAENAVEGEIVRNVTLDVIKDGDMIICRNNAPLIQIYNEFLKLGKKAFIRGKDIGNNLKSIVKSTKQDFLNADCKEDGVFVRLYDDLFVSRNKLMDRFGIDDKTAMESPQIQNKLDMIKALEILAEGINTSKEIMEKIDEIFPKRDKKSGISLSTIHKAKGLESNNVYIACESLMPSKSAKKDWEIRQEYNLMYVAYTRAKNVLGFIDEKDFDKFDTSSGNSIAALRRIEYQVNKVLGKTTKIVINNDTAKDIVKNAKKIDKGIFISSTIDLNTSKNNKRKVNSFANLLKNKKKN